MPIAPQIAVVTCPACSQRFTVEVHRIIDVGQNPQHKGQFLGGQLNQAVCPQCGNGGMLALPLLYHDPGKELAGIIATEIIRHNLIDSGQNDTK